MDLTEDQITVLLKGIAPHRVAKTEGYSNMEGYDVRAMLIRIFGFGGWDDIDLETTLLYDLDSETKAGAAAKLVAYRSTRRLIVRDYDGNQATYDGTAVGEAKMPEYKYGDAHDMAVKTAQTQALKRCVTNLGDQFGLSLYKKGSLEPLVRKVVGFTPVDQTPAPERL
jgi:recombination DNA repair RAD52 pathway protein